MADEVEKLLRDKGIYFTISGADFVIKCLNIEHEDSNPSFRIDKTKGIGHCFSCGYKVNIFKHFGIITNMVNIKVAVLKEKLNNLKQSAEGLDMLDGYTPFTDKFRNISQTTMREFDMFYTDKVKGMEDRAIIPLKDIKGNIKMFIGRHVLSKGEPRYMIYPKASNLPLLPPVLKQRNKGLVLVEGMFDMLNLYDKGLHNVCAVMGTQAINNDNAKYKFLPFKAQGVANIYICFDGDDAGRDAGKLLKPRLESYGFIVEIVELEDGTDPGGMNQEDVDQLSGYINDKN